MSTETAAAPTMTETPELGGALTGVSRELEALRSLVEELQCELAALRGATPQVHAAGDDTGEPPTFGRRRLLAGLGAAGAGAVAAIAATATPAAAADGDSIIIGATANTGASSTRLLSTGAGFDVVSTSASAEYALRARRTSTTTQEPAIDAIHDGQGPIIRARQDSTGFSGRAVDIEAAGLGTALWARSSNPSNNQPAVIARTIGTGNALESNANSGTGVRAHSTSGIGVSANGGQAPLHLFPSSPAVPTSGSHSLGEVRMGVAGGLYVCTASSTPGTWRRAVMAAPGYNNAGSTGYAGSVNLMSAPFRLFDSRPGEPVPLGGAGKLAVNTNVVVQVTGTIPTGGGPAVPTGAIAVLCNLTVTQTENAGFVVAFPAGVTIPGTSNVNWFGTNQNLAASALVRLDPDGRLILRAGANRTHAIVDVIGFVI